MGKKIESASMKIGLESMVFPHSGKEKPTGYNSNAKPIEQNVLKINTTASKTTCGRMSFKGNSVQNTISQEGAKVAKESFGKISTALSKSKAFKSVLKYIEENTLMSEAIFALFVTGLLRPATIMMTPSKAEDKEKNKYAAAKSIASGVIGLVATAFVSQPIKKGVNYAMDKIKIEPAYKKSMQNILNRIHNPAFLPLRAAATIALVPLILGVFGIKKASKPADANKQAEQNNKPAPDKTAPVIQAAETVKVAESSIDNLSMILPNPKVFQSFAGVSSYENK